MATTTIINSLTLTSVPTLPSVNANITGSVRLPQFKGLKIKPSLKTRSFGSLSQNPSSKLAPGASVVCMADATGLGHGVNATTVETNGVIYNKTKHTITFVVNHDWAGKFAIPCPRSIEPLQGGTFKHDGEGVKSSAAVVYSGRNVDGILCDFLLAWSKDSNSSKKAYTEIQQAGYPWDWDDINAKLDGRLKGCVSDVTFDNEFKATLKENLSAA